MTTIAEGAATTLAAPASIDDASARVRGWIHSAPFDLGLFTLSPLAGLVVIWPNLDLPGGMALVVAVTYLVGIPHYLSTFTFFLGDENLAHYRTRWAAFFLGPVLIFAAVCALRVFGLQSPVTAVIYVWNVYHVSLQSAGILSLYRRLNRGPMDERPAAHLAILSVSAALAFSRIEEFAALNDPLTAMHPLAPAILQNATALLAVAALLRLGLRLLSRTPPLSRPEAAFLLSSLTLFHPYLWVRDVQLATFGMLVGHFIQYLAIVWLLTRRKYADGSGSARQRWLAHVASRPAWLAAAILGSGLSLFAASRISSWLGGPMAYVIVWNALTLVHFYLDGLIWAFRRPFVRETIGPYLTPPSHVAP